MSKFIELLPYWCYAAGSILFLVGTAIVIWRAYAVH